MILIGIILIALSFTLWYFIIPPITGLSRDNVTLAPAAAPKITFLKSNSTNPSIVHFGSPIDHSFNLSMNIGVTNGLVNVTIYVLSKAVFTVRTNFTTQTIIFDSSLYNNKSVSRPAKSLVFPNITATVPSSFLDAFTGGITPYMIIRDLNATSRTSVSFYYSYDALHRDSNGIPLLLFVVGAIIVIVYGIAFVRRFIESSRSR